MVRWGPPPPLDPATRRREALRAVADLRAFGPEVVERNRRYLTDKALALAGSLAASDLDALTLDELTEVCALLAGARGSGPSVVA